MDGSLSVVFFTCLMVSGVPALKVVIPEKLYEHARGDNITLPCTFESKLTAPPMVIISWSVEGTQANAEETLILTYYSATRTTDIKSTYEGRVALDVDIKAGKANLKLFSITLADNKVFECRVLIPKDDEGIPADTARLVVLVAPSKPICKIEGNPSYGQDIQLTCHSKEGSPPPVYKWESRDVKNLPRNPRAPVTRSEENKGVLSLFNITRETSGYYTCTSSNKIRSATCNITLSVMPPSMNVGSTAGIIAAVVILLLILIIVIYCCCCRKKKDKQENYAMGVQEEKNLHSEAVRNGDKRRTDEDEEASVRMTSDNPNRFVEGSESGYRGEDNNRRRDYEDRDGDDDRRRGYEDRGGDYDDRRRDYDDRRSDYDDHRKDYDDRRRDYEDRRSDYTERPDKYADRHERYDDDRRYDDEDDRGNDSRYDEPDDDRDRPPVPSNKPRRRDLED